MLKRMIELAQKTGRLQQAQVCCVACGKRTVQVTASSEGIAVVAACGECGTVEQGI